MGKLVLSGKAICLGFEAHGKADFLDISLNFLDMYVKSKHPKNAHLPVGTLAPTPQVSARSEGFREKKYTPVAWFRTHCTGRMFAAHLVKVSLSNQFPMRAATIPPPKESETPHRKSQFWMENRNHHHILRRASARFYTEALRFPKSRCG